MLAGSTRLLEDGARGVLHADVDVEIARRRVRQARAPDGIVPDVGVGLAEEEERAIGLPLGAEAVREAEHPEHDARADEDRRAEPEEEAALEAEMEVPSDERMGARKPRERIERAARTEPRPHAARVAPHDGSFAST